MAQLFFRYGAMNSGKSFEILKVAHNYEEQNKAVLTMTSALDTRSGCGKISSRVGQDRSAMAIYPESNVFEMIKEKNQETPLHCVLVDEAQFLLKEHIYGLARIVDELKIPVMAFGLKNDFQNELFEGSKYLLILADKIEEVKTICWFCEKKATMNLRIHDQRPVYTGEKIQVGAMNPTILSAVNIINIPLRKMGRFVSFKKDKC